MKTISAAALVIGCMFLTSCGSPTAAPTAPSPNPAATQQATTDPAIAAQKACRKAARAVFAAVMAEPPAMTQEQGQAKVDAACDDVDATNRAVIIDAERERAIANYYNK